jgi:hypothetical protein
MRYYYRMTYLENRLESNPLSLVFASAKPQAGVNA